MAKFELYIPLLSDFEGGYVDDPDDLGGATNMGITYRTYCEYYFGLLRKGNTDRSRHYLGHSSSLFYGNIRYNH